MKVSVASPHEIYRRHVETCPKCAASPTGMCPVGFSLLGEISGMRRDRGQMLFAFADSMHLTPLPPSLPFLQP